MLLYEYWFAGFDNWIPGREDWYPGFNELFAPVNNGFADNAYFYVMKMIMLMGFLFLCYFAKFNRIVLLLGIKSGFPQLFPIFFVN